jgi:hypothetical protein
MRDGVITEADTCREFVTPRLVEAGWGTAPHVIGEQRAFTDGLEARRGEFRAERAEGGALWRQVGFRASDG